MSLGGSPDAGQPACFLPAHLPAVPAHLPPLCDSEVPACRNLQAIFDALAKTLPCRWDGDRIVVLDEVGGQERVCGLGAGDGRRGAAPRWTCG